VKSDVALNLYDFVVRRPGAPAEKYGLRAYDEIILASMVSRHFLIPILPLPLHYGNALRRRVTPAVIYSHSPAFFLPQAIFDPRIVDFDGKLLGLHRQNADVTDELSDVLPTDRFVSPPSHTLSVPIGMRVLNGAFYFSSADASDGDLYAAPRTSGGH